MAEKNSKPGMKRLSKGIRKHNRRLKQEERNPTPLNAKK